MIRQATTTDFPELADIYHDASLLAHPFIDPQFIAKDRKHFRDERLPLTEAFVYEVNGQILGFISISNGHINGLFVGVDHQRKRVGTYLVDHAKERHPCLELYCFVDNYQAQRFYHSLDFEITGELSHAQLPLEQYIMQWRSVA